MPDFEKLLQSIEALQKAQAKNTPNEKATQDFEEDDLTKSFLATVNGKQIEAIDGTALVKALTDKVDGQQEQLNLALSGIIELLEKQGEIIAGLQNDMARFRTDGKGRQSAAMAKSLSTPDEFLAKSLRMTQAGQLTPNEITTLELCGFKQDGLPAALLQKINSAG